MEGFSGNDSDDDTDTVFLFRCDALADREL